MRKLLLVVAMLLMVAGPASAQYWNVNPGPGGNLGPWPLLTDVATGTGESVDCKNGLDFIQFYVIWGSGTSAGAVQLETSDVDASTGRCTYTGRWAPLGVPIAWSAASKTDWQQILAPSRCVRARVSTAVVPGTVRVRAYGIPRAR